MKKIFTPILIILSFIYSCDNNQSTVVNDICPKQQSEFMHTFKDYSDKWEFEENAIKKDSIGNKWFEYVDKKTECRQWVFLIDKVDDVFGMEGAYQLKMKMPNDFNCDFTYGFLKDNIPLERFNLIKQLNQGDTILIDGKLKPNELGSIFKSCNVDIEKIKRK